VVARTPLEILTELGGVSSRKALLRGCKRADVDRAVASGDIVCVARSRYALATIDEQARVAARLGGVLALSSAALRHGWAVKTVPDRPHVMVSRGRRVRAAD
jgi:hypothetical protein